MSNVMHSDKIRQGIEVKIGDTIIIGTKIEKKKIPRAAS